MRTARRCVRRAIRLAFGAALLAVCGHDTLETSASIRERQQAGIEAANASKQVP